MQMPEDKKIPQYVILMRGGTYHFSPNIPLDCTNVVGVFNCVDSIDIIDRKPPYLHKPSSLTLKSMQVVLKDMPHSVDMEQSIEIQFDKALSSEGKPSGEISIELADDQHTAHITSFLSSWTNCIRFEPRMSVFDSNLNEFSHLSSYKLRKLSAHLKSL